MRHFALALCLAPLVPAQSFYAPSDTPTVGTCNAFPFSTTDMRYQALVLASDLGGAPATIRGFGLAPCTTGLRSFTRITVRMAHLAAGSLSTTFDQNLAAGPVTVMDIAPYTWHMTADVWNDVDLQNAFAYNGVDNLVVEFMVTGSTGTSGTMRRDATHQRVYLGSYTGQPIGTNGGLSAFKMRLVVGDATTQVFGAGCLGSGPTPPELSFSGSAQRGTRLGVQLTGAPANTPVVLRVGASSAVPFPFELSSFGAAGCFVYHDAYLTVNATSDSVGAASITFQLPRFQTAVGWLLYFQWGAVDPLANALGLVTSSYGRALVGN